MSTTSPITEADIFADIVGLDDDKFTPDVAKSVLQWKFTDRASQRMSELADRNNKGTISESERDELERYLRVGSFINIVQAKARLSLKGSEPSS
jgi:hypothetical protein